MANFFEGNLLPHPLLGRRVKLSRVSLERGILVLKDIGADGRGTVIGVRHVHETSFLVKWDEFDYPKMHQEAGIAIAYDVPNEDQVFDALMDVARDLQLAFSMTTPSDIFCYIEAAHRKAGTLLSWEDSNANNET